MGVVYKAIEPNLGRAVAIKILKKSFLSSLPPERAQEARDRFVQEARAAARLSHPGITTIFRVSPPGQDLYIAMEWLDGESLEEVLTRRGMLPPNEVAELGVQLLEALNVAHAEGVIHRDIKPANIMVLHDGRVKIADFGVARMKDSSIIETQAGAVLGTPLYASPEQLHGHDVDARADLYSVAVVLYEAISGKLPYEASSLLELVHLVISDQSPPGPETHNANIPSGLSSIIMAGMHKSRESRHNNALAMASMLKAYAQEQRLGADSSSLRDTALAEAVVPIDAPVVIVQGAHATQIVAGYVSQWPSRELGTQPVQALLNKLMERPLHTRPFSGAAKLNNAYVLLNNGLAYAVFDPETRRTSDAVYEELPTHADVTLYGLPDDLKTGLVVQLASMLHPSHVRQGNLDSSFVAIPQMVNKLMTEQFSGVVRFQRGSALAYLLIESGAPLVHLFSTGWPADPLSRAWHTWIAQAGVTVSIEDHRVLLSSLSYHRELASKAFDVVPLMQQDSQVNTSDLNARLRATTTSSHLGISGFDVTPVVEQGTTLSDSTLQQIYMSDPMYFFLHWMGREMPSYFAQRERVKRWKYLVEWVALIRRAQLYHELPRPKTNQTDDFDLVTYDEDGKVLHLMSRYASGSAEALQNFIDRVLEAKTARIKTGDVGGACFIAPEISPEALALYDKLTSSEEKKKKRFFSFQDSMTGYEGFVRIGARRGFHLLLIVETEGSFKPIFPAG